MCGIWGEVKLGAGARVGAHAEASLRRIAHRGPDDQGLWIGEDAAVGVRRLSIIDIEGGNQPIWNADRSACIVFNGELYNFLDLRPELEALGHRFATRSDTEVVLHAYDEWGTAALDRLNGMFAFAIWDERRKELFVVRDRIGEKPLYWWQGDGRLVFASEVKAILADPAVPREVDLEGLGNYLAFGHGVAPTTAFRGIRKLLPAHTLRVRDGDVRVEPYWDVPRDGATEDAEEDAIAREVLELLDDSVRRRLIADVPVGAFLSGGVDSSAVVSLMARHAPERVKTFSIGFTATGGYDERPDARLVAEALGTDHHELEARHVDLVETLRTLVYHYDEPFADPAGFPLYLLSRFAREHVTVVLTGDGGDELFGGYRRYAVDRASAAYRRLPGSRSVVPALVERLPRMRRLKQAARVMQVSEPARRYAAWLRIFTPELQDELLADDVAARLVDHDPAADYPRHYEALNGSSPPDHLNRLMYVDLKSWLPDAYMEKTDKATMACSLEARLPLLDHRLVELAFRIPGRAKIRGLSTKRILKRAVAGIVPPAVLRKRKHGFSVPTDPWFRGELRTFAFDVLLDERTKRRGYFDARVVERLWREHVSGRHVWDTQLWTLLNLELWHRFFIDGEAV